MHTLVLYVTRPDFRRTVTALKSDAAGREVFLYVISGHKQRNPAAAMALIERVG